MNEDKKNTWLKFVVGGVASCLGLYIIDISGGVCNALADARWPDDFESMVIASNQCEGGAYLYVGATFVVSYYLCGYLTEKRQRPIIGACVGLAAGVLVASLAAMLYFNFYLFPAHHY